MGDDHETPQSTDDWPEHAESAAILYAYAHALLLGEPVAERFPLLAAHLARCAACRDELAMLLAETRAAADPEGPPSAAPPPDLSRLPKPWESPDDPGRR